MKRYYQRPDEVQEGTALAATHVNEMSRNVYERLATEKGTTVNKVGNCIIIGGGGGSGTVAMKRTPRVPHLPAIDVSYGTQPRTVMWLSYETGLEEGYTDADGDDQLWTVILPQQRWYPAVKYTASSGIPIQPL